MADTLTTIGALIAQVRAKALHAPSPSVANALDVAGARLEDAYAYASIADAETRRLDAEADAVEAGDARRERDGSVTVLPYVAYRAA